MRIGIDARVLMNKNYSGVSWYAFNILTALFESDHENEYVLFYNSNKSVSMPEFNQPNVSYKGFRWSNKAFNFCLNFFSWPKLDKLIGGCDVFFTPNLHFVSWSADCRKVIVVHDLSFLAYPQFFNLKQRLWHKLILNKKILAQADVIIADSESTKRDLIALLNIPQEKIKVVYLGMSRVIPTKATLRSVVEESLSLINIGVMKKLNLPEKYFLFVGTIEPRKNLAGAIKALEQLPADVKLAVAGQWGWKFDEEKHLMENNDRIIKLGYVEEAEKAELYQHAVALVYPSFYEGFGLPILEAMTLGCPVICGNNSSQGEVAGDAGVYVDPFNINEIKQAMELMLTDADFRQGCVARGYEQAKNFSWQKTAEQTREILENSGNEKTSL